MIPEAMYRLEGWLSEKGREQRILLFLLASGMVARMLPLLLWPEEKLQPVRSEMWYVALNWAETGVLADAYFDGSGISSHVGPLNTMLAGSVYRWFGTGSQASELILSVISVFFVAVMIWFFHHAMREMKIRVVPVMAASAALAILPLDWGLESHDFRVREGTTATLLMGALLWWLLRLDREGRLSARTVWLYGLLAGLAFLVHPVVALGAYAGLGLVALRHMPPLRWPAAAMLLLVSALAVNGAWIVRNAIVYDRFMPSRGNFGLELAVANYPGALHAKDDRQAFKQRMRDIHPTMQGKGRELYRQYSRDIDYFDAAGHDARAWIDENPREFALLSLKHLGQLLFPPSWLYNRYTDVPIGPLDRIRQGIAWASAGLSLLMLAIGLAERRREYLILLVTVAPQILLYSIMQPTLRYRYLLVPVMLYLAAELLWRALRQWAPPRPVSTVVE